MRESSFFHSVCMVLLMFIAGAQPLFAQGPKEAIKQIVESKNYVFQVQSMSPRRGGLILQSPGFMVRVRPDTLDVDLPYVGRAYQATYGSSDNGLRFTTTDFAYGKEDRKKGGWVVKIKPKDSKSIRQLILTISDGGMTYASIICNDRESISYNGYIEAWKKR